MARKKETEPTITKFKNSSSDYWINMKHYKIEQGTLQFVAGGIEDKKETELLKQYLKL